MPRQSFRGLLGLIAAALIFQMAAPNEEWARLLTIGLQGLVVIAAFLKGDGGAASLPPA